MNGVGIGLRAPHYESILTEQPNIGWLEVHSENYFGKGGKPLYFLEKIAKYYPLSFHGVGLSLGSADSVDLNHLKKLKKVIDQFQPSLVSDHLCWSSIEGVFTHDLLPLPYTEEAFSVLTQHIDEVQTYLGRTILIENISSYLQFAHSTIPENEFILEISNKTGCGILLDISNLFINCFNHGWNALDYLKSLTKTKVKEIHLGGMSYEHYDHETILIDTHNKKIDEEVWKLYQNAIQLFGPVPTLIEWDQNLPELKVLLDEAEKAKGILECFKNLPMKMSSRAVSS